MARYKHGLDHYLPESFHTKVMVTSVFISGHTNHRALKNNTFILILKTLSKISAHFDQK